MKKLCSILAAFILSAALFIFPTPVEAAYPVDFECNSQALLLVNLDTGTIVFEQNPDQPMEPASVTKIMVAILLLENISDLENTQITADPAALDTLYGTNSSLSGIKRGEILTAEQLLHSLLIPSGNDAAVVIANYLGNGSLSAFVDMMNQKAREIGCTNTHFANPHGLHDPEHYTTARDIYIMTEYAMEHYPKFMEVCEKTRYTIPPTNLSEKSRVLATTNLMTDSVNGGSYYYRYVKGVKTGSTEEAGYCLVSTAFHTQKNYRYLCVALGAPYRDAEGKKAKNGAMIDTKNLYEWAFNELELKTLVDTLTPRKEIKLEQSWNKDSLLLVAKEDFATLVPKTVTPGSVLIVPNDDLPESVKAPVEKGQVLGTAKVMYANMELGTIDLVASETVSESQLLKYLAIAKDIVQKPWVKVLAVVLVLLIFFYFIVTLLYNRKMKKREKLRKNKNRYRRF